MKIVIISDVHNNLLNLKKVIDYSSKNKIKNIICCGDLASLETLNYFCDNFGGKIYFVFGNMDNDHMPEIKNIGTYKNAIIFSDYGEKVFLDKKVAFVHFPDFANKLASSKRYEVVFYGHTHKPWEDIFDNCRVLNPGSVTGDIFTPTFALWDLEKDNFSLLMLNEL